MKRAAIYSAANRARKAESRAESAASSRYAAPLQAGEDAASGAVASAPKNRSVRSFLRRNASWLIFAAGGVFALVLVLVHGGMQPPPREYTQDDIDAAVLHTLENKTLPSRAAKAAEAVRQSVVRVRGYVEDENGEEKEHGVGSGVVIVEDGIILTNLHVVAGVKRVTVTFFDGLEAEAELVGTKPATDLAVVRAKKIPDDLVPATLGSTQKLQPGDEVVAVGFPFGIGPSVSARASLRPDPRAPAPPGNHPLHGLNHHNHAAKPRTAGGPR